MVNAGSLHLPSNPIIHTSLYVLIKCTIYVQFPFHSQNNLHIILPTLSSQCIRHCLVLSVFMRIPRALTETVWTCIDTSQCFTGDDMMGQHEDVLGIWEIVLEVQKVKIRIVNGM